jgi:hypothetical protein
MTYVRFLQIEQSKRTIAADIGVSSDTVDRASRKSSTARGQAVERRLGGACWGFPLDLRRIQSRRQRLRGCLPCFRFNFFGGYSA